MSRSFVKSAVVLMAAAAINRIIGFIYQATVYRLIGPEGIGLYNLVTPVYILLIVIATAGIPLGISKLVSEQQAVGNKRGIYQIFWLSLSILTLSGGFFCILTFIISPWLQKFIFVNEMIYPIFLCLIPGIFIVSVSSALRGFFQGLMSMKPPALAQVLEQITRVVIGVFLALHLLPRGIQWAAMGVALAGIIGELIGLVVLIIIFLRQKPRHIAFEIPDRKISVQILKELFSLCTPITLGRIAATIMLTADSLLIPYMLRTSGLSVSQATAIYGQLTSVALTLLFIPSVITVSLATSLVPSISEAIAQNRPSVVRIRTRNAVRLTIIAGIPFIAAYQAIPDEIIQAVYGTPQLGWLLAILALGGLFAYVQQTSTGILQGMGMPVVPLKVSLGCGAVKLFSICFFGLTGWGIKGVAYSYVIFFVLAALFNVSAIIRRTHFSLKILQDVIKPLTAGIITLFAFKIGQNQLYLFSQNRSLSVAASLLTGFLLYFFLIFASGALSREDLKRFSFLKK